MNIFVGWWTSYHVNSATCAAHKQCKIQVFLMLELSFPPPFLSIKLQLIVLICSWNPDSPAVVVVEGEPVLSSVCSGVFMKQKVSGTGAKRDKSGHIFYYACTCCNRLSLNSWRIMSQLLGQLTVSVQSHTHTHTGRCPDIFRTKTSCTRPNRGWTVRVLSGQVANRCANEITGVFVAVENT